MPIYTENILVTYCVTKFLNIYTYKMNIGDVSFCSKEKNAFIKANFSDTYYFYTGKNLE